MGNHHTSCMVATAPRRTGPLIGICSEWSGGDGLWQSHTQTTIRKGVLTLLNMGPRDPTLLHVRCGVCGKAANTIVDIDTPKWVVQLEARSPRRLAKPPCRTCFLRPRLSPHAPGGSPPHAVATSQQLQRPPRSSPSRDSRPICCRSGHSPASLVACRSDASWHLHSAPPSARKDRPCARHLVACAPARTVELERVVQHQRVLRQRSQPRRTTCPPQRSSSSRFRAISSRPEPVR